MDIEKSLVWNLQEQAIVEHPTIAIVHKDHADFFVEGKIKSLKTRNGVRAIQGCKVHH